MYTIADSKINFMEYTMKNVETYEQMIKRLNRNTWIGIAIAFILPIAFILFFNLYLIGV